MNYIPQMASIAERVNNPVKLVQCVQAHNEEEFITFTLRSIYKNVDKILIAEGAVKNRPKSTEDGHSTDRTIELIEEFIDKEDVDKKVTFIKINRHWRDLEEIKQTFLDFVDPGDWIIINDADEFYRPEDIDRLRLLIDRYPHATEFTSCFLHFYRDFQHVAVPGPEWNPQHQRIIKCMSGMKYNSHPVATDQFGQCTYFSSHYQPRRFVPAEPILIFHYGYARQNMDDVMREKQAYYEKELVAHGGANKKFDRKVSDWFENSEPLLYYDGDHPAVMSEHSLANSPASPQGEGEKLWREDSFYSKSLLGEEVGNIWLCMNKMAQPYMNHYHNAAI